MPPSAGPRGKRTHCNHRPGSVSRGEKDQKNMDIFSMTDDGTQTSLEKREEGYSSRALKTLKYMFFNAVTTEISFFFLVEVVHFTPFLLFKSSLKDYLFFWKTSPESLKAS